MEHLAQKYPSLSVPQFKAVTALAAGKSHGAAAKAAGVHRDTIYDWRNNHPDFTPACTDARFLAVHDLLEDLKDLSREAIDTLREVIRDKNASPASRVRASLAILNRLEGTSHEGWALPQPIQEADHIASEREAFGRDHLRTERYHHAREAAAAAQPQVVEKQSRKPQNPAKSVTPRDFPKPPLNPTQIDGGLPSSRLLCGCGSGKFHHECCLPRQLERARKLS